MLSGRARLPVERWPECQSCGSSFVKHVSRTFGVRVSEWFARQTCAERLLGRPHAGLFLCGSCPSAGRAASGGADTALSVMDYRRLLMSRVVPGQFDDADSSDR